MKNAEINNTIERIVNEPGDVGETAAEQKTKTPATTYLKTSQKMYLPIKRLIGFFGSVVGIILCSVLLWWWVLLINAFVTKGHPVFARHRIGKDGKAFKCIKFRSMKLTVDPHMTSRDGYSQDNITSFGKFLRKTSIDETLQLFNVLVGQMAFIGPRPLIDVSEDVVTINKRRENGAICLRPGISGYAQIHGRELVDPIKKGEMDGYYLEHFGFCMDVKIFFKTIMSVLLGK